jgi:hypothetical protein
MTTTNLKPLNYDRLLQFEAFKNLINASVTGLNGLPSDDAYTSSQLWVDGPYGKVGLNIFQVKITKRKQDFLWIRAKREFDFHGRAIAPHPETKVAIVPREAVGEYCLKLDGLDEGWEVFKSKRSGYIMGAGQTIEKALFKLSYQPRKIDLDERDFTPNFVGF